MPDGKQTVTYLIKRFDSDLYVTNKPTETFSTIKYSTDRRDAREFDGLDNSVIDMTKHKAVKKTVTEQTTYEVLENE